jgi:hypothetical protein
MSAEAMIAAAYAGLLVAIAVGVDLLARHSHNRTTRYRTAGFEYHGHLDAWICPEGEHLHRVETDERARLVRYRAKAHLCNACPTKGDCTDSERGREVVRPLDPWPHSEAGRFHRGFSVVLVCLAAVVVVLALVRNHSPEEIALLGSEGLIIVALLIRMAGAFRRTPSEFPAAAGPSDALPPSIGRWDRHADNA